MARLLVATDLTSLAQRGIAERLAARIHDDGHEADVVDDAPLQACRDADGVIALIDGSEPGGMPIAVAATASALGLPTLALHTHALPTNLASLFTQANPVTREADLVAALPSFYATIRPFAGKLVRDQVPRLVREAGHQVQFREAAPDERARYLKRKVADEADELLNADPGQEREEVADLLEALEALLRVRGYDREDLKLIKDAKRKRRGAFDRFLIVESATKVLGTPSLPPAPSWPAEERRPTATTAAPEPDFPDETEAEEPVAFQFPDEEPAPDERGPASSEEEPAAFQFPDVEEEPALASTEEPSFALPEAFTEPEQPMPDVALPNWMEEEPAEAAVATTSNTSEYEVTERKGPAPEPTHTPMPLFQSAPSPSPPPMPSFRIQKPPVEPHGRTKLWNLGKAGNKEDIPDFVEDPDRIEPKLRDI